MKLATGRIGDRDTVLSQNTDGHLVDVGFVARQPKLSMRELIELDPTSRGHLLDRVRHATHEAVVSIDEITWRPPILNPSKIVGVALNNDVFNYLASRKMNAPMYFLSPSTAMTGHRGAIRIDPAWGLVHPEPELAAVIGTEMKNVAPEKVLDAIFGYTIINDVTSPGLKADDSVELVMPEGFDVNEPWRTMRGPQDTSLYLTYHARSKGTDTFAPIGPWITLAHSVPDPNALGVRGYLDDELVLEDSTANLTFSIETVLAHLSQSMTLLPGDIVHFGTAARPTRPDRFPTIRSIDLSQFGGTVSIEIDTLGRLDNSICRSSNP